MSLGDFLRKQFIDVIQWTESGPGVLMYRFPMQDMEIQSGGKLTVRESQLALFVNEGRAADMFSPGLHTLVTANLPLLTNLQNWDKAFQSPFKSDVYFFSTRVQTGQRWGTQQPITIRDKEFGAVRLRAFGMYAFRVSDPAVFQAKVGATDAEYTVAQIDPALRNAIMSGFTSAFANAQVPFLDMAANQAELAKQIAAAVQPAFTELGLTLESFTVENLSLPDELQKRLDERISMNMIGDMRQYTQFQAAQSIPIAAANQGGMAGLAAARLSRRQRSAEALRGATGRQRTLDMAVLRLAARCTRARRDESHGHGCPRAPVLPHGDRARCSAPPAGARPSAPPWPRRPRSRPPNPC